MRSLYLSVALLAGLTGGLGAQEHPAAPAASADSLSPVRQRIRNNFRAVAKEELGLTDAQSDHVLQIQLDATRRRQALETEQRRLNQSLAAQLRPGVAADPNSVKRIMDSLTALHLAQGRLFGDQQNELATFLTPIQRAQLYRLEARLYARIGDIMERRQQRAARPGGRMPARRQP